MTLNSQWLKSTHIYILQVGYSSASGPLFITVAKEPRLAAPSQPRFHTAARALSNAVNHTLAPRPLRRQRVARPARSWRLTPPVIAPRDAQQDRWAALRTQISPKIGLPSVVFNATVHIFLFMYPIVTYKTKIFLWSDPFFYPISYYIKEQAGNS